MTLCSLAPLSAEKNGAFIEGGFQYSNVTGENNYSQPTTTQTQDGYTYTNEGYSQPGKTTGNLYGADIQAGYKQFFGKKKRFGLRYYGLFSGQGGSYVTDISAVPSQLIPGNVITGKAANLFYGAGIDALYNFYEKSGFNLGVFAGVMLGGSSWLMGTGTSDGVCAYTNSNDQCSTMNTQYLDWAKADKVYGKTNFSPTFVQFIINIGFRTNFSAHQGFEVGVRIPTINDPYYTEKDTLANGGGKTTVTFRRTVAIYANYVYNF
ncbi:outer membrane protein [Helicobacter felistomachi]|uniref:outer membrane protein n=1 Tax=Helicobacter felistomachi TaxID=3040201 RepID=UPI002573A982|nr:outer membrane protein [Helicobacter sp. NHP21005]